MSVDSAESGGDSDVPYDLVGYLTEIDTGKIDADYMNSRFDKYLRLIHQDNASAEAQEQALNELHRFDGILDFSTIRLLPFIIAWSGYQAATIFNACSKQRFLRRCFTSRIEHEHSTGRVDEPPFHWKSIGLAILRAGGDNRSNIRWTHLADCDKWQVTSDKFIASARRCACATYPATYQSERVDAAVIQIMHDIFDKMAGAPDEDRLKAMIKRQTVGRQAKQRKLSLELQKNKAQLEKLQLEIANVLTGNSLFSPEDLSSSITTMKGRIAAAETELHELEQSKFQQRQSIAKILPAYNQFKSWADEFDSATKEQKKMIACQLFKRIEIGRNYAITCELNMTYQQFCEEWSNTEISKKMAI